MAQVSINSDLGEWGLSTDSGERARLLQSPSVDIAPKSEGEAPPGGLGRGTTSTLGAIFIVVNACLGAGLLNFPAAFSTAGGVAAGITLQMAMLVFIISGLVILAYCSQASNERTYQEVVWAVCGKLTGVLCEVAIATYTFGTCIAFLIIIGDQQDKIIAVMAKEPEGAGGSPWYTDRKFTISLTAFLFILPLSIPREIGFQKYASFLSVVGTWYVTAIIIIKYIWPDKEMTPADILNRPASWIAVFNAMPTICFGFQCHVSSVPVFNSMQQPEVKTWGGVVTAAMVIALAVYMGTGICGFLTFGAAVDPDVLLSYPSEDMAVAVARAFIILSVLTSYPILHFCGRAVVEGLWLRYQGMPVEEDVGRERRRRVLQTLVWFLLTLLLALFIPDIGKVISVIGGLAACFIFVFPAGGRWSVTESSWSPWEPSSSGRPQPTPFLWISWHNHCLPGNSWPLLLDPGTHLVELQDHPESGIIPLYWWDDIWTSFSRDSSGVKSGPTPLDSSNPAPFLPPHPGSAMDGRRGGLVSQNNLPPSSTSQLLHAWKPWVKRVGRSWKEQLSLTSLWRKSVDQGLPSSTEKPALGRGCAHYPGTQCLLRSVGSPASSGFLRQVPKVALKSYRCAEAGRLMPCPLPPGPAVSLRALLPIAG
ncbi:putative sodium-coupled neutral amino acid transporter 7 isoform X1 [Balaenoptera musculus]|uniref:Sodium-coupled neutral amino acid transporter 7 n=1 Tax=Balaenoptera musculus TaxID=9771 RepID=A0A8B8VU74_BALMU|nr:putative sodium-coupled neutral amino acid transporter 7 isoform X1 [Balaenoptera musculus]XP_036688461.1 putative sodium-coupled neutral amino acid transporter 7 isoform X1 [Balaenoptera musculus]XP_036688462.1 putative sodium-coupled neutral amino acid transporter 7 isoform X1 [Balaenoptera musculus]XP_036688463.1 putative sodium-coupled neutral amino acid transporter 7 isoform X1 [Balaenoptera musculus]